MPTVPRHVARDPNGLFACVMVGPELAAWVVTGPGQVWRIMVELDKPERWVMSAPSTLMPEMIVELTDVALADTVSANPNERTLPAVFPAPDAWRFGPAGFRIVRYDRALVLYFPPEGGRQYMLGIDTATGHLRAGEGAAVDHLTDEALIEIMRENVQRGEAGS